jgi:hypothetical protein
MRVGNTMKKQYLAKNIRNGYKASEALEIIKNGNYTPQANRKD